MALAKVRALRQRLIELTLQYSGVAKKGSDVLVAVDYYRAVTDIKIEALGLRNELLTYLVYMVSQGLPASAKDAVQRVFLTLTTAQKEAEELLAGVLSEDFVAQYMSLLMTFLSTGQVQVQPLVLQIPVQPVPQGGGRK